MPTQVQFRRGTTEQNNNFLGAAGELSVNTSNNTLRVHDGVTMGGFELAKQGNSDTIDEGVINLYFTTVRSNTSIDNRVTKSFIDNLGVDATTLDGIDSSAFALDTDLTTANVAELTNLYFTNARARLAVSQGSGISYNSSTGVISANVTSVAGRTGAVVLTNADISGLTTANVTELTNQYFTNDRARLAVSQGSGVSYNNSTGVISANVTSVNGSTGAITGLATTAANLSQFASTTSAQLASIISDETGSGSLVFATSPTLVTPILGTPQSGTLTNATGLPIVNGTTGTLSVARGGTGVTTSTGTGAVVLATSPTLVTPILGTPQSGTLTNATGLPIVNGTTGTLSVARGGTGVTTSTGTGSTVLSASPTFTGTVLAANLTISGDLTINGTTTTINSTTLTVDDKNIELGSVGSPSDATADGGGITLKGTTDKTFNYIDATTAWTSNQDLNLLTGKIFKINGTSVLSSTTLGTGVIGSSLTSVGTITTGVWNGSSISTTFTDAKVTSVNGQTGAVTGFATTANSLSQFASTTSSQLATLISDETGSGSLVFATSPTLVTPILGTPQSGTLTNATGLPIVAGTTGTLSVARGGTGVTSSTGTGNTVLSASPTFTGTVSAATINVSVAVDLGDNDILRFGTGDDWEMFHDGTTNRIDLTNGDLVIRDDGTVSDPERFRFGRTTGNFTATGNIAATGTITSPFFYSESDIALKENVNPISNALKKVLKLTGVDFIWKTSKQKAIGVIAQDVEKILPEIVGKSNSGFKTIQYDSLIPLLIEAIKEQQKQIDDLRKKVK